MKELTIYAGEDFLLTIEALQNDGVSLDDLSPYEVVVQLSVEYFGNRIIASTLEDEENLVITRESDSKLSVYITHTLTENLPEGELTLSLLLTDKDSGRRIISELKTINVKRSKLTV